MVTAFYPPGHFGVDAATDKAMIEALIASGVPAIVREVGDNTKAVDFSGAGFVYHDVGGPRVALDSLAGDRSLRVRMGCRARKAFETYCSAKDHVTRYLALLESIRAEKQHGFAVGAV